MAKTEKNKLAMIPGEAQKNPFLESLVTEQLPDDSKLEKLNMPPLIKCGDVPIGATVSGKIVSIVKNFTGKDEMRESLCIRLEHKTGTEFLFPVSGSIKQALKAQLDDKSETGLIKGVAGRTVYFTRQIDGKSKKYGGKPMFLFDVRLEKA